MKKPRILIVEDERILALDLSMCLTDLGHEIAGIATTGEEAIQMAEETKPDLVLMDIILAGDMDGIEAAEVIYTRLGIPFIYVTAHADKETRERAESTEPAGYLIKPVRLQELGSAVENALSLAECPVQQSR